MSFIGYFISQYGFTLIYIVLMVIITYVGMQVKTLIKMYVDNQLVKDVVKMVCETIEHLYKDLTEEEKLNLAIVNSKNILEEKEVKINDLELRILVESTLSVLKK